MDEKGVTFPVLLDNKSVGRKLYKVRGTPTTFIINGEGLTVFKHVGHYEGIEDILSREVQSLLGGPA